MKKKEKPDKELKKKPEVIKTCLDILPVRRYDEEMTAFVLVDGSYVDILQILPRDLDNMDDDELEMEILRLMRIFRTVGCDLKFISMKFPLDLSRQKAVLRADRERLKDEARQTWLGRQILELEQVERSVATLHFYVFYFGSTQDEFLKHREAVLKYAGGGAGRLVAEITAHQKRQILKKLCNMNTAVDLWEREEGAL